MQTIRPGRKQKGWAIEQSCTGRGNGGGGCGALLLVEEDDVFCTYSHSRDETDVFYTFRCQECGVLTDLALGNIPSRVRQKAEKRSRSEGRDP
jgi:hypothetical protein